MSPEKVTILFDLMGFKIDLGLFSSIPSRGKLIIFLPRSSKWETQNILNLNKGTGNFIFLRFQNIPLKINSRRVILSSNALGKKGPLINSYLMEYLQ